MAARRRATVNIATTNTQSRVAVIHDGAEQLRRNNIPEIEARRYKAEYSARARSFAGTEGTKLAAAQL